MIALLADEAAVLVEHPGDAAGHAGAEVVAGTPSTSTAPPVMYSQPWSPTPSTTAIAPGVADGEALAGASGSKQRPAGGSIERDVAEDDVCELARAARPRRGE